MIISVNKECMNFISQVGLTTGEFNAHEIEFKFTLDFNNLIKIAVFQNGEKIYKVKVENDKVVIPWEVLEDEGNLYIGVYGYEMEGNNLKLRYSPKPIQTNVSKGSFLKKGSNTEPLTPTDKEVIFSELNNIDLKTKQLSNGVEIEMTNPKGETTKSIVYNGKNGKDGKDGSDYVITEEDYQEIADVVEGQITIPTKTSQLQNDSNFVSNTDYASQNTGGVVRVNTANYGSYISNDGVLGASQTNYENYQNKGVNFIIGKGTLENVITGKGLVSNTAYATNETGGVIKVGTFGALIQANTGILYAQNRNYSNYQSDSNNFFISKGTLENVITGKRINTSYSADETVVGTYLGKPLYRKIIQVTKDEYTALPTTSNSRKGLDVSSLNINMLVNAVISLNYTETNVKHNKVGYMHRTDTNNYELGCHDTAGGTLNFFIGNSILTGLDGIANILLEYTKTTD